MAIAIGIAWLAFMCVGVPIAFVLGASAMVGVLLAPDGRDLLPALVEQMFIAISSFNFLAIPLFVFTGGILAEGGIAKILMDLATITIGRGRGGMGASIVASAMIFHGISGSSSADAAAIGKVTLPTLRAQGYPLPSHHHRHRGQHVDRRPILRRNTAGLPQWSRTYGPGDLPLAAPGLWQCDGPVLMEENG
jgi:C4-dicarboxylate transporter DctM subunit